MMVIASVMMLTLIRMITTSICIYIVIVIGGHGIGISVGIIAIGIIAIVVGGDSRLIAVLVPSGFSIGMRGWIEMIQALCGRVIGVNGIGIDGVLVVISRIGARCGIVMWNGGGIGFGIIRIYWFIR